LSDISTVLKHVIFSSEVAKIFPKIKLKFLRFKIGGIRVVVTCKFYGIFGQKDVFSQVIKKLAYYNNIGDLNENMVSS